MKSMHRVLLPCVLALVLALSVCCIPSAGAMMTLSEEWTPYLMEVPDISRESFVEGAMNETILWVQTQLKALGFYSNQNDELTGVLGGQTKSAIQAFQGAYGLPQSGLITQMLLYAIVDYAAIFGKPLTDMYQGGYYNLLPRMSKGMSRNSQNTDACIVLQRMLRMMGYYKGAESGYYDSATEKAVYQWETQHGWEKQACKLGIFRAMLEEYISWGLYPEDLLLETIVITPPPVVVTAVPARVSPPVFSFTSLRCPDVSAKVYGRTGPSAGQFNSAGIRQSKGYSDDILTSLTSLSDVRAFYLVRGRHDRSAVWAYIEFSFRGEMYRMYTTKLAQLGLNENSMAFTAEYAAGNTFVTTATTTRFGPGTQYANQEIFLYEGQRVDAYFTENDWIMVEFSLSDGTPVRGWVPRDCVW